MWFSYWKNLRYLTVSKTVQTDHHHYIQHILLSKKDLFLMMYWFKSIFPIFVSAQFSMCASYFIVSIEYVSAGPFPACMGISGRQLSRSNGIWRSFCMLLMNKFENYTNTLTETYVFSLWRFTGALAST